MSELELHEIVGVAKVGLRAAALMQTLDDLSVKAGALRVAHDELNEALYAANTSTRPDGKPNEQDRAVVDAAKNFAHTEENYLRVLQDYLLFAVNYDYGPLLDDDKAKEEPSEFFKALFPEGL